MDAENYLVSARKQFEYYQLLGQKTMDQLDEEDLFNSLDNEGNSIAVIVKHLWGNMLSRWTNFLTEDGEKDWRKRDEEFELDFQTREELTDLWNEGWTCLFQALDGISEANFHTTIYIRNQGHTILEAVNRQLCHYAYHVGQMVLIGKLLKGANWNSLSIPKGQSKAYNQEKFTKEKGKQHFTDEYLDEK